MGPTEDVLQQATWRRAKTLALSMVFISFMLCQIKSVSTLPVGYPPHQPNVIHSPMTPMQIDLQRHTQLRPQHQINLQQLQPLLNQQQQQQPQQQSVPLYQVPQGLQLNQYTKATHELLLDLRYQMMTRQFKFDDHFKELLRKSKLSLHNLFLETYGMIYEKNVAIFTSMFESLEQYYANGQVRLTKSMENFFLELYQKIFQAYNLGYGFSPNYLECTSNQLTRLRPFGELPDKMIAGIRHGFLAARTFNQALSDGIDVIKNIISLGPPTQCTHMINEKLLKSTLIVNNNSPQAPKSPCPLFCEQVISRCIGNVTLESLNDRWRSYVTALGDLAKKMTTTYNIETIIAPLSIQLSEAIMTFQENGKNISDHLFKSCGKPVISEPLQSSTLRPSGSIQLSRRERAANPVPIPAAVNNRHNNQHITSVGTVQGSHWKVSPKDIMAAGAPLLDDLTQIGQTSPYIIDEIKNYMLSTKFFWHNLPKAVCASNHTLGNNASRKQSNTDCYQEKFTIHDVNTDIRYRNEMHRHILRLEGMKSRIDSALSGTEIDWTVGQSGANPGIYPNSMLKPPFSPMTTTTTTTTPPSLAEDEEDCEEGEDCDFEGSGAGSDDNQKVDDFFTDPDAPPEDSDDGEDITDGNPSNESTIDDTSEEAPTTQEPDNDIDKPTTPQDPNDLTNINLISPPNQPYAQTKSSQTSSKLVISCQNHLLLALLMYVALSIVTHFQLTTHRSTIRHR